MSAQPQPPRSGHMACVECGRRNTTGRCVECATALIRRVAKEKAAAATDPVEAAYFQWAADNAEAVIAEATT